MTDLSGFAVGLVASLALHAALMVGAGALRGTAPSDPELTPVEDEAVALDLANVDLSFSEEERDEAPVNPMPTAVPAVAEAVPPPPAAQLPELPPPGRREGAAAPESPAMQEAIQGNKQP